MSIFFFYQVLTIEQYTIKGPPGYYAACEVFTTIIIGPKRVELTPDVRVIILVILSLCLRPAREQRKYKGKQRKA